MFEEIIETRYLSAVPIAIYSAILLANATKIRKVFEETRRAVRFDRDLQLVREAINFNMRWAVVAGGFYILYFFAMAYLLATGGVKVYVAGFHLTALSLVTYVGGRHSKKLEAELKNLDAQSADPTVRSTYERSIRQWGEARLRLPD
jgi:hypothetical protein